MLVDRGRVDIFSFLGLIFLSLFQASSKTGEIPEEGTRQVNSKPKIAASLSSLHLLHFKVPTQVGARLSSKVAILSHLPNIYLDFPTYISATLMRNVDRIDLLR